MSVIPPNENKGKSYIEHTAAQQGTSWKAQIKADVNASDKMKENAEEKM